MFAILLFLIFTENELNKSIVLLLISIALFSFYACEDDPSSVGQSLLEGQDLTNVYTLETVNSTWKPSYIDSIALGSARRTLVGRTANLNSTGLLKFYFDFPDSIKNALDADVLNILSATINLRPTYYFGDQSLNWDMSAYEITNEWGSADFNKDSLQNVTYNSTNLLSNLQIVDDTTITSGFNTDLVKQWMKFTHDSENFENEGIILIPGESTARVIGFPALTSDVDEAVLPQLVVIVESPGEFVDTLYASLINDAYAVEGELPAPLDHQKILQGGLPARTNLKFNLSGLSKNSVIIDALLSVYSDTLNSDYGSKGSDSLVVSLLTDFENNVIEDEDDIFSFTLIKEGNVYKGNIRRYVQRWLDELSNEGMQLKLSDEDKAVTKVAVYDNTIQEETLKPRLQIIYTDVK